MKSDLILQPSTSTAEQVCWVEESLSPLDGTSSPQWLRNYRTSPGPSDDQWSHCETESYQPSHDQISSSSTEGSNENVILRFSNRSIRIISANEKIAKVKVISKCLALLKKKREILENLSSSFPSSKYLIFYIFVSAYQFMCCAKLGPTKRVEYFKLVLRYILY